MDPSRLTQKSHEALTAAQALAVGYGHTEVDAEHVLLALLEQEGGLAPRLFEKMDVSADTLRARLDEALQRKPRVSGPGTEPGKVLLG